VLARAIEAQGVATTSISMVREHTERVKPPRALFVPFPFGHALGRADDPELQHRVLGAALALLAEPAGPVLRDFPDEAEPGEEPSAPVQASAVAPAPGIPADAAAELAGRLALHTRWLQQRGRTAAGLSGLPPARLVAVARFMDGYAAGAAGDWPERPAELPLAGFLRHAADDVKAIYWESYMAVKPAARGEEIARWFWGETAMGQLLRRVRDRLDAAGDPASKAAAFGIAR
jgi:hypothetical protein